MSTLAINGFGRIGRNVFKIARQKGHEIAFINDITDSKTLAHLLKYDSMYGKSEFDVQSDGDSLVVNGVRIPITSQKDPSLLPTREYGVQTIIESTGRFTDKEAMSAHIQAGAKRVILTAPAKSEVDATVVMGVNDEVLKPEDVYISNASCTTNCLAMLAHIVNKEFGIVSGFMNTVHSYTNDQNLLDLPHKDLRRARAAAVNIVPSSTGAAKALGLVIQDLNGKMDGLALRVPTPVGSIVDLTVELTKQVTKEEINSVFKRYAESQDYTKYLEYVTDPIVSSDIIGNSRSCIFDSTLTQVIGQASSHVKIFGWYDNEWGYSNRVVDLFEKLESL